MEFNKLVSLVLGFIVLILVFVWISNRFRASTRTAQGRTPTITPTFTPTPTPGEGESTAFGGWNPFGFLTRRSNNTPTPTVRRTSPSPTAIKVQVNTTITGTRDATATKVPAATKPAAQQPTNQVAQKPSASPTVVQAQGGSKTYTNNKTGKTIAIAQIPETGAPSAMLPIMLAGLSAGIYLRRRV